MMKHNLILAKQVPLAGSQVVFIGRARIALLTFTKTLHHKKTSTHTWQSMFINSLGIQIR